jgi:hypothetical protein
VTMIKLKLPDSLANMSAVRSLPGLAGLALDEKFGIVAISPRESLYVIRTVDVVDDLPRRRALSPEIVDAYGEVRISAVRPP